MGYVFISYSTKNQQMADSFRVLLNQNGIETWMAPGDIPFGSTYTATINRAIKDSSCFMLLFSESAQNSQWVPKETERAVSSGKTIFTVLLDDVLMNDSFEFMLSTSQAVAIRKIDENDEKIKQLLKAIKVLTDEIEENLNKDSTKSETVESSEKQPVAPMEENQSSDFVIEDGVLRRYIGKYDSVDVVIPEDIKIIGNYAFDECGNLKSITITDSVTTIGMYAFKGCTGLNSVIIPSGVTTIEIGAFKDCKNITSIEIPSGVVSIGAGAFENCENLISVTIPDSIVNIPDHAFAACDKLSSVIISEGVKSIGNCAFIDCHSLITVAIPDSVTSIENYAFSGCKKASITIPSSATIGDGAFNGCKNVVHMASVEEETNDNFIEQKTAESSEQQTVVSTEEANQSSDFVIEDGVLKKYVGTADDVVIPDSVTSIGECAFFDCKSLVSVTIPHSVTSIGGLAFEFCDNLVSVKIPDSVKSIGDHAFPDSTKIIGDEINWKLCGRLAVNQEDVLAVQSSTEPCDNFVILPLPDGTPMKFEFVERSSQDPKYIIVSHKENSQSVVFFIFKSHENTDSQTTLFLHGAMVLNGKKIKRVYRDFMKRHKNEYRFTDEEQMQYIIQEPKKKRSMSTSKPKKRRFTAQTLRSLYGNALNIPEELEIPDKYQVIDSDILALLAKDYQVRVSKIIVPDSVEKILDTAFAGFRIRNTITIPDSVTSIGAGAISLSEDAYVTCSEASYAYKYCKEAGLRNLPDLKKERMSKKVCQHCGGKFSGLFKKKCSICGKEKDY